MLKTSSILAAFLLVANLSAAKGQEHSVELIDLAVVSQIAVRWKSRNSSRQKAFRSQSGSFQLVNHVRSAVF